MTTPNFVYTASSPMGKIFTCDCGQKMAVPMPGFPRICSECGRLYFYEGGRLQCREPRRIDGNGMVSA